MAVTAELSRRLHQTLGDESATELVNWLNSVDTALRSSLMESNRRNWELYRLESGRKDAEWHARFEQRFGEIRREIAEFRAEIRTKLQEESASIRSELQREIGGLRSELQREIGGLRSELQREIGGLRSELHQEVGKLRGELREAVGGLRNELHQELGGLRGELHESAGSLRAEMHSMRADLVKWMFLFWTGSVVTLGGLMIALRNGLFG